MRVTALGDQRRRAASAGDCRRSLDRSMLMGPSPAGRDRSGAGPSCAQQPALHAVDGEPHPLGPGVERGELEGERRCRPRRCGSAWRGAPPRVRTAFWVGCTGATSRRTVTEPSPVAGDVVADGSWAWGRAAWRRCWWWRHRHASTGRVIVAVTVYRPAGQAGVGRWVRDRRHLHRAVGSSLSAIATSFGSSAGDAANATVMAVPSRWWPARLRDLAQCDRRLRRVGRLDPLDASGTATPAAATPPRRARVRVTGSGRPRVSTGRAVARAGAPRSARPTRGSRRSAGSAPGSPTTAATSPRCPSARA